MNMQVSSMRTIYSDSANFSLAEHIWEKHFVKTFLNLLSFNPDGDGPVATCNLVNAVFNTVSTSVGSQFENQTPAQALANTVSCFGGNCPDNNRVSEFYILENGINQVKTVVSCLGQLCISSD